MARTVAIGVQDFETIITNDYFYVDKTNFIKEWWESGDSVTLISRPRRFGKTLNMSMLEAFFSNKYEKRAELFENLNIWKEKKYREIQGTYPVISLSFANIKEQTYELTYKKIIEILVKLYAKYEFLLDENILSQRDRDFYEQVSYGMDEVTASLAIHNMSDYLSRYYGRKVIILLDEYDTPMQEAYVNGYWDEFAGFIRSLFNSTFKTNPYMERAVMTGITRVSKESIFSDLNNLTVITTTSKIYAADFGFTEEEVFTAMDELGLKDKAGVKTWYDGFVFGDISDIYNPWSIINYFKNQTFMPYWANTSSNSLVGKLIRESGAKTKKLFEQLLEGEVINVPVDEQLVYKNLDTSDSAVWSLMLATGYLKVLQYQTGEQYTGNQYAIFKLAITNEEVKKMFYRMVSDWFGEVEDHYNDFITALLTGDLDAMNEYMESVTLQIFGSFDTGRKVGKSEPERFYHGFVLGLMVDLSEKYILKSNRESGLGRYDIMIYPKNISDVEAEKGDAIIIEFKVKNKRKETDLEQTVEAALKQIEDKKYDVELKALGFKEERIRKYGFAFEGKNVLIGEKQGELKSY
ncbi:MAG: AAA family ATPase [Lachnospiraceae bacterium]|nr:AAA family ATPase [Lachnospiraceae bacterium]